MSSCLCHIPANTASSIVASASMMAKLKIGPILPAVQVKMKMAANAAAMAQLDAKAILSLAYMANALPAISAGFGGGGLMQVTAMLKLVPGTFNLMDPIKLQEQLAVSAGSIAALPPATFKMAAALDMAVIAKLVATARLIVELKGLGLDPIKADFSEQVAAKAAMAASLQGPMAALPPPLVLKLKLAAGLPQLVKACEVMEIPLGDPSTVVPMMQFKLNMLARIVPPTFPVSIKLLLKVAAVVEAMATIAEAFGPAALSPAAASSFAASLSATLTAAARANVNFKLIPPNIPIPPMEDIKMGEKIAGSSFMNVGITGLKMPAINILPPISAIIALRATLGLATGIPPMNLCTMCGSS